MSTVTLDYKLHKFDKILLDVSEAGTNLIKKGYDRKNICIFMSADIRSLLFRIFNKYVENPLTKYPKSSFMGYKVYHIAGKNVMYIGIKVY